MARTPRVAAHLGRPETPDEERLRKAENSRNYRRSKTFTNLIIAMGVTLLIVAIVYFIVPRGELEQPAPPDVPAIADDISTQLDRAVITPPAPDGWGVNIAELKSGPPAVWTVNYNDIPEDNRAFVRFAQAFDVDDTWASQLLGGAAPTGEVTIDGIEWTAFEISTPSDNRNISYALGVEVGPDFVLVYGSADAETTAILAGDIADAVASLQEEVR